MAQEKQKKRCGEKVKSLTVGTAVLFSVNAQTSEANILHLKQMTARCSTYKWCFG